MSYHYSVFTIAPDKLENFLNSLEKYGSGRYEILTLINNDSEIPKWMVVVRFIIDENFDSSEIKKKLGF